MVVQEAGRNPSIFWKQLWLGPRALLVWVMLCVFFPGDASNQEPACQCRRWQSQNCCSVTKSWLTVFNPRDCSTPDFPDLHHSLSLLKLRSIMSVMTSNYLIILCPPLLLLPSTIHNSGSFLMTLLFISGSQSIEASASVLAMNIQG